MMWIERLPAAVTATALAGLHGGKGHLLLITSLAVTTATAALAGLHRAERYLILLAALLGVTTATAAESELAESLLNKSGDKGRHFWFI
jgi:hypothetical protein